jgi:hypothetical protein
MSGGSTQRSKIARDGRFTNTAFLIENYPSHVRFPSMIVKFR